MIEKIGEERLKNIILRTIEVLHVIALVILLVVINVTVGTDARIKNKYDKEVKNAEIINTCIETVIEEGVGIHEDKIDTDAIEYEIKEASSGFEVKFKLKESTSCKAKVTLSKNYKILEQSKLLIPEYDKYRLDEKFELIIKSIAAVALPLVGIYLTLMIVLEDKISNKVIDKLYNNILRSSNQRKLKKLAKDPKNIRKKYLKNTFEDSFNSINSKNK